MIDALFTSENYNISKKMMDISDLRHKALAANISNAETPGYKRIDIDKTFEAKFLDAIKADEIDVKRLRNWDMGDILQKDRDTESKRQDGNNVELDTELVRMNRNAMEFEFHTKYLSDSIKSLNKAIRGRVM